MKQKMMVLGLTVLSLGTMYLISTVQRVSAAEKKKCLRVGVYDSRGIAIAYAHSEFNENWYQNIKVQLDAAEAAGDEQKVQELREAGNKEQAKKHLRGFGTAPVHDCLEPVKDKIAEVAKEAGVDVIISKWEFDYLAADAETVDVTNQLAKLFNPGDKAWEWIEQIKDKKPYSHEELEQLEKEHPH